MIELKAGEARLVVRPELGAAVAAWERAGSAILYPVSDPNLIAQHLEPVAAYPLLPYSNRIGYGRFTFEGQSYQLDGNFGGEPHTIHGNGWERSWTVASRDTARLVLTLDHNPPEDPAGQWPFRYHAEIEYALRDQGLAVVLRLTNTDTKRQPVGLGFHPFFPRAGGVELGFEASGVWQSGPDALPSRRVPVADEYRFLPMRAPDGPPIDNCYDGWTGSLFLRWPERGLALTVTASAPMRHLVVFTPPGKPYIASEPVSNMSNAINHPELAENGLVVLAPGETMEASVEYDLTAL